MHPSIHAQNTPDKPAYIMASTGEATTYGELEDRSNRVAQYFRDQGLEPGDHIALMMENNPRLFEIVFGAQRAGLYYTAISSRLTAPEAAYIVNDCGAQIFFSSTYMKATAESLPAHVDNVRHFLMVDGTVDGYESYEDVMAGYPAERIADEIAGADMLYSSGTTGRPKGVKPTLLGLKIDEDSPLFAASRAMYGYDTETVYLSPAPLYHAAPLRFCMTVMRCGGTVVVMEHFDPEEALRLIEKYRITHSQWVPTMFVRMLKMPKEVRHRYDLSSHRVAVHAAAPCPVEVKKQMIEWWGPILLEYYAGSEANGMTFITSEEWLKHPGSVGRPMVGELQILDDDGNELPAGETGHIYFKGGPEFQYHNDPKKTEEARAASGASTLGDVGYVDEDGYLYLTDRKAFMIISGGVNIYPQEVEDLLITHPRVADVAVFGVPSEDFGEEVKAVVQPMDWADAKEETAQELIAFCRENLSHIKCPKTVDFMEELPRHPTGKLYKRLLRDRYWGRTDTGIVANAG